MQMITNIIGGILISAMVLGLILVFATAIKEFYNDYDL